MIKKHQKWALGLVALLAGCGPNVATTRKYLSTSAHRSVAVLPLDMVNGQKNMTQQASDMMANKMRAVGFLVADRQKTRNAYNRIKDHAFDQPQDVADLGKSLGVQA